MTGLSADNRMAVAKFIATILTQSTALEYISLCDFSEKMDAGEGEVILKALSNSPSLSSLKSFSIGENSSWFSAEK